MPRTIDLSALKARSTNAIAHAVNRHAAVAVAESNRDYLLARWIAQMTAVEIHAVWERYVEGRLITALNHNAAHFLSENGIVGVTRVSSGLASYIVRSGSRYFDFRSMSDLISKTDKLIGTQQNPFRALPANDRNYIDALAAIRNCVVHRSDAALAAYKRTLRSLYGIASAPEPDEFLNALDRRTSSPARNMPRLHGLSQVVSRAIQNT
jgi:hypothetical protein